MTFPLEDPNSTQILGEVPSGYSTTCATEIQCLSETLHKVVSEFIDPKIAEITEVFRSLEHEIFLAQSKRDRQSSGLKVPSGDPASQDLSDYENRIQELESLLRKHDEDKARLTNELAIAEEKLSQVMESSAAGETLRAAGEQSTIGLLARKNAAAFESFKNEIEGLRTRNQQLEQLLANERARSHCIDLQIPELNAEIEHLHEQLSDSANKITAYEFQVDELSRRLMRLKGPESTDLQQTMTWEERKGILLHQLERETDTASGERFLELLDIEQVISETSYVIQKKDAEIQSLIKLIEEQSVAHDSIAVGATAFATTLDNDAMIMLEREKLRKLQADWEEQQRQFEIEISMERAKLARDQLELQQQLADLRQVYSERPTNPSAIRNPQRQSRWLSQLGLCDE